MATHSCATGYQLSSSTTTRTCQSDRMWSGDDITCQGTCSIYAMVYTKLLKLLGNSIPINFFAVSTIICTDLTAPANGMIGYNAETMNARPVNTVATFSCITGYMLSVSGDMTRTCEAGVMWSGTNPTCECESIQCA